MKTHPTSSHFPLIKSKLKLWVEQCSRVGADTYVARDSRFRALSQIDVRRLAGCDIKASKMAVKKQSDVVSSLCDGRSSSVNSWFSSYSSIFCYVVANSIRLFYRCYWHSVNLIIFVWIIITHVGEQRTNLKRMCAWGLVGEIDWFMLQTSKSNKILKFVS